MILSRRILIAGAIMANVLAIAPTIAAENTAYTPEAFNAAQKAGRSTLVEIHAPWCATCKAQSQILGALENQPQYKNLIVFRVDFDTQKDAVRGFGATMQSTLITFKDGKETGRSVGDANKDSIAALLAKSI